ncbi:MAG: hypothetical protein M1814_006849 [Vezdaea aestivalis]|nr:MAG: hypothetical protein M1814_006849 [Vezdaea aestivalis]
MLLLFLLSAFLLPFTSAIPLSKQDVEFLSLPSKLTYDHSGRAGDPPNKYFHESVFHCHYDGRFASHELPEHERNNVLSLLIQSYLASMAEIGVETWLQHGSLLGWWWNQRIFPWDSDIDVQVSAEGIAFMANYYNMTMHSFLPPDERNKSLTRDYMLEVNPNYIDRSREDSLNVIDARWVDVDSGLFIDITALTPNLTAPESGTLSCKDKHDYKEVDIFPLRTSFFEGQPVKIPFNYADILVEEYTDASLVQTVFEQHRFNQETLIWEPIPPIDYSHTNHASHYVDSPAGIRIDHALSQET